MDVKINKKAQISIFIVVAIFLITTILLYFFLQKNLMPEISGNPEENPSLYLHSCLEPQIEETLDLILKQGGHTEPKLYKTFKFEEELEETNITYLCYTNKNYLPCTNQEPMLIQHLKKEIYENIKHTARECFDSFGYDLEEKGYTVDARYSDFEIKLSERKLIFDLDAKITLTKTDQTSKIETFRATFPTRLYDLSIIAQEITNQESKYCHFDTSGFMLFYPEFKIDKFNTGDLTTIYTIKHKNSEEKFRFATRSCVIPPGI